MDRLALVIGNSDYLHVQKLNNPKMMLMILKAF